MLPASYARGGPSRGGQRGRGGGRAGGTWRGGGQGLGQPAGTTQFTATYPTNSPVEDTEATSAATPKACATTKLEEKEEVYLSKPDDMIKFLVGKGDDQQTFLVHKEFVNKHSPVLKAAFEGPWIEGASKTHTVEDVAPKEFRLFAQFLYAGQITLSIHKDDVWINGIPRSTAHIRKHINDCGAQKLVLVQLWVLAEKFLVYPLQDHVMDHLFRIDKICLCIMHPLCLDYVYSHTSPKSLLRRFAADCLAWHHDLGSFAMYLPHAMLIDVVKVLHGAVPDYVRAKKAETMDAGDYNVAKVSE